MCDLLILFFILIGAQAQLENVFFFFKFLLLNKNRSLKLWLLGSLARLSSPSSLLSLFFFLADTFVTSVLSKYLLWNT